MGSVRMLADREYHRLPIDTDRVCHAKNSRIVIAAILAMPVLLSHRIFFEANPHTFVTAVQLDSVGVIASKDRRKYMI
jgi:hypothetical protein